MNTKIDLANKAKSNVDINPNEAIQVYRLIWSKYPHEFNEWDAFFAIKSLRKSKNSNLSWAKELVVKFPSDRVLSIYSWFIFDQYIRDKSKSDLIDAEEVILFLAHIVPQKNLNNDSSFPCPKTIAIFKLIEAHTDKYFNGRKVLKLLDILNPNFLSQQPNTIKSKDRGEIRLASDLEKYYALKSKSLLDIGDFLTCKTVCNQALRNLKEYHHDNDLWFKMRMAISDEKLGNFNKSKEQFKNLISTKSGNGKWFFYREIADCYFEQGEYEKAWKYSVDAAFYGNEPQYMIGLYYLQTRILYKLNREADGQIFAKLIFSIIKEQNWRNKDNHLKLRDYYNIKIETLKSSKEYLNKLKDFLRNERYKGVSKKHGEIVSIHPNGKKGRVRDQQGNTYEFHKRCLANSCRNINKILGSKVSFFPMLNFDDSIIAEFIQIIKENEDKISNKIIGKEFDGFINGVVDFGVFVRLEGYPDALLHKSNIPKNLRNNLSDNFKKGDKIAVTVEDVTPKGIQLRLQ